MNIRQSILFWGIVFGGFASIISANAGLASPHLSQTKSRQEVSLEFPATGRGRSRTPGVKRCPNEPWKTCVNMVDHKLTVLMPENNIGTTIANPTMVWFIPENKANIAEFFLFLEDSKEIIYTASFAIPEEPNLVKFELPKSINLKQGITYSWSLAIDCDPETWQYSTGLMGSLERKELDKSLEIKLQEQGEASLEKVAVYAQAGIWNEALLGVLSLREKHPDKWREFLNSVELGHLEAFPVFTIEEVIEETINQ